MSTASIDSSSAAASAKRQGSNLGENLARAGYYGKGLLYMVVGILAARAAFGLGGSVGGSKDALSTLAGEGMFGTILLWVIAFGLVGYSLWNGYRAIIDPENEGDDKKGIGKRIFFGISSVIHASLAIYVFTHLLGSSGGGGGGGGSGGTQGLVGSVLAWGMIGRIIVFIGGAVTIGFAVQQLVKAYKVDLSDQLDYGSMSQKVQTLTTYAGRGGLAARGVVFTIVGLFVISAAWTADKEEAGGLGAALQSLGSFGGIVLGVVAIGLALYGVYMILKGRYRRIEV